MVEVEPPSEKKKNKKKAVSTKSLLEMDLHSW